jgi:hypothetical protein
MAWYRVGLSAALVIGISLLAVQPKWSGAAELTRSSGAIGEVGKTAGVGMAASQTGGAIIPGFSQYTLPANDDGSTSSPVPLPFPVHFYGNAYSSLYVNNNGNLTFGSPLSQYTPESLNQISLPMIAPFWADVDTRVGPVATYGYGTVNGHAAFGANWIGVGCYSEIDSVTDTFQVLLISRPDLGQGDYDIEFNYGPLAWETGQASGGNGQCLGGSAARAGYTSGHGPSCELPGSGLNGGLLSSNPQTGLSSNSENSSVTGRFVFGVTGAGQPNACSAYVALGDSYSSGEGTGYFNYMGSPCDRGSYAWPALLSAGYPAAPPLTSSTFWACSGDTIDQLLNGKPGESPSQLHHLQQWTADNGSPSLLTLTIGGNTLGFADILWHCVVIGAPSCLSQLNTRISYVRSGAYTSLLKDTYSKIKAAAGGSPHVVVVGYPFLFPRPSFGHDLLADAECPWLDGDAAQVLSRFQEGQQLVDSVAAQAAAQAGVRFIQLGDLFAGHELCTTDPYINHLVSRSSNAGHPNITGQFVIAHYVAGQLGYLAGIGGSAALAGSRTASTIKEPGKASAAGAGTKTGASTTPVQPAAAATGQASSQAAAASAPAIGSGLADGEATVPYTGFLWATGGSAPYTWSVTSGNLPAGLSLDPSTGIISGTPAGAGTSAFTVAATDSGSPAQTVTANESITIIPVAPLAMQNSALPSPTVGQQYSATVPATGGIAPYTWSVSSGSLPAGLTLDSATGTVSGTPTSPGSSTFTIQAADSSSAPGATATATFTLNVVASGGTLTLVPPNLPGGTQGIGYTSTLRSTGGTGPLYWSVTSGNLPAGVSLNAGTGELSGIPTASGTFAFTARVTDAASRSATENLSITVAAVAAPSTATSALPDVVAGTSYDQPIDGNGGVAPYSWSVSSGALPAGLSLDPASGVISGTPTAPGTYSFTVTLADSATPAAQTASADLSITVDAPPPPPAMTLTDTVTDGTVGTSYNAAIIPANGTGPYNYTVTSGSLPDGLNLDSQAGTIIGTPTTAGSFTATIQATDSSSPTPQTAAGSVSITVVAPGALAIDTTSLLDAAVGAVYAQPIAVGGGTGADSFTLTSGALPSGLTLDPATGIIYGTPTTAGSSSFTVTVTDSSSPTPGTASAALTLTTGAEAPVSVPATTLPDATLNVSYLQSLTATGGAPPYGWSVSSGALPGGLSLDPATGIISGTPTASGVFAVTVEVTDSSAQTATESLTLTVDPAAPLSIGTTALGTASQGSAYSASLDASGGTSPVTWSVTAGSLPAGLTLDPATGIISGTPSGSGTSQFTIKATDSSLPTPQTATVPLSIKVMPAPPAATATGLALSSSSVAYGHENVVTFTATVSSPSGGVPAGTVKVMTGNTLLCGGMLSNGKLACSAGATLLPVGAHGVTASYSGSSQFAASASPASTLTVVKALTKTVLTLSSSSVTYGRENTLVFTTTVSPQYAGTPGGTVTVKAGTITLCAATLSGGHATCSPRSATVLGGGAHTVTVSYSGNNAFGSSSSAAKTLTVVRAASKTVITLSSATVVYGHEKNLVITVTVSPQYAGVPTGPVTVTAGSTTLCKGRALLNGKVTCSPASATALPVGTYSVNAVYFGSANFQASTSAAKTLKVAR